MVALRQSWCRKVSETDFTRTREAIVAWDRYFTTWWADLNKLGNALKPGEFDKNNELALQHFDAGIKHLCATVGEAFANDTNTNNRDIVLDVVFGRGTRVVPGVPSWVRELAV